jgi:hypothetical protein
MQAVLSLSGKLRDGQWRDRQVHACVYFTQPFSCDRLRACYCSCTIVRQVVLQLYHCDWSLHLADATALQSARRISALTASTSCVCGVLVAQAVVSAQQARLAAGGVLCRCGNAL